MKFMMALSFLLGVTNLAAIDEATCFYQGQNHGSPSGDVFVSDACVKLVEKKSSLSSKDKTLDNTSVVFGYRNILVSQIFNQGEWVTYKITGAQSRLEEIQIVKIDPVKSEIYVLAQRNELYIFRQKIGGNIAPIRKIQLDQDLEISSIAIDHVNDFIILAHKNASKMTFFSRLADKDGRRPANETGVKKTVTSDNFFESITSIDFNNTSNEIIVYDKNENKVFVFEGTSTGGVAPKKIYQNITLENVLKVSVDHLENSIVLTNNNGDTQIISL